MEKRNLLRHWLAVAAVVVLGSTGVASTASALDILEVAIDRGVGQGGGIGSWFVEISVVGTDLNSATLTSSTGFDIVLAPSGVGQLVGGQGFMDLAALNAAFPIGTWMLDFNAGELAGGILYSPEVLPNGSAPISSPILGAGDVDPNAAMIFSNSCTNCQAYTRGFPTFPQGPTALVGRLQNLDSGQQIERVVTNQAATQINFMDPFLANTNYRFETTVSTREFVGASIGADSFNYFSLTSETRSTDFSTAVPEPGTALLVASGLALLAARRRQRHV